MFSSNTDIQFYDLKNFTFTQGTTLPSVRLAYQIFNPKAAKTALIPTCFRGRISTTLNFCTGALYDYKVIVVALFGNGESSSPSNTPNFPKRLDYRDCVRAQHALVTMHLGLDHLDTVLGFSMGGQCAYHWIAMHPMMVGNAVIICSSARTSLHNIQFLEGPKAALVNSADYVDGSSRIQGQVPLRGLHAFGTAYSAWLTSAEWFEQELFQAQGYANRQAWADDVGRKRYEDWHPEDLLVMLDMWQRGDVRVAVNLRGENLSLEEALAEFKTRILLMPCLTDQYFKKEVSEREATHLPHGHLAVIPSVWGHLAGSGCNSEDNRWMERRIADFLQET
ncbi:Alpha/Beta hydrolase protein [Aspergillus cavernicola]|uniref:Alpha/Beta hydrolase protein n=1 Tax=Aspergillus cavernicola TaxID=176166 RepID=A0ABR4HAQ8_9EURO